MSDTVRLRKSRIKILDGNKIVNFTIDKWLQVVRHSGYNVFRKESKPVRKDWQSSYRMKAKQILSRYNSDEDIPKLQRTGGWLTW